MVTANNDNRSRDASSMARIYSVGSRAFVTFGWTAAPQAQVRSVPGTVVPRPLFGPAGPIDNTGRDSSAGHAS
jgi:hypothetical protein